MVIPPGLEFHKLIPAPFLSFAALYPGFATMRGWGARCADERT
jgi:hypothetical protein